MHLGSSSRSDPLFPALRGLHSLHAISSGSDSKAVAYIGLKTPDGKTIYGVGIHTNIFKASIKAVLCAINRDIIQKKA